LSQGAKEMGISCMGSALQQCIRAHRVFFFFFFFFKANRGIPVVQQPPYSPHVALYDFWLFSKLKIALKGKRFNNIHAIKENTMKHLSSNPKDSLKKYFQQWQNRWHKCIASEGAYFEGD
jgi:hypothetical protein